MQFALRVEPLTRDDVMTAGEVADLLHLPLSTVYELARRGVIPAHRIGRRWRFIRRALLRGATPRTRRKRPATARNQETPP